MRITSFYLDLIRSSKNEIRNKFESLKFKWPKQKNLDSINPNQTRFKKLNLNYIFVSACIPVVYKEIEKYFAHFAQNWIGNCLNNPSFSIYFSDFQLVNLVRQAFDMSIIWISLILSSELKLPPLDHHLKGQTVKRLVDNGVKIFFAARYPSLLSRWSCKSCLIFFYFN